MNPSTDITPEDHAAIGSIYSRIIGWSDHWQYAFFKALLEEHPEIQSLLMVGVYYGRDIAFIQDVLARYHPGRKLEIVGVDRFSSAPCADWPSWATSWEHLTNGMPAPDVDKAAANVSAPNVTLLKMDDVEYLSSAVASFDAIYLDASHDEASLIRQLGLAHLVSRSPDTILCGDDFSNLNGWGVKSAVEKSFTKFDLFADWIWHSKLSNLKS